MVEYRYMIDQLGLYSSGAKEELRALVKELQELTPHSVHFYYSESGDLTMLSTQLHFCR